MLLCSNLGGAPPTTYWSEKTLYCSYSNSCREFPAAGLKNSQRSQIWKGHPPRLHNRIMSDTDPNPREKRQRVSSDASPIVVVNDASSQLSLWSSMANGLQQDLPLPCTLDELPPTRTSMEESPGQSLAASVLTGDLRPDPDDLPGDLDFPPSRAPPNESPHLDYVGVSRGLEREPTDEQRSQAHHPDAHIQSQNASIAQAPVTCMTLQHGLEPNCNVVQETVLQPTETAPKEVVQPTDTVMQTVAGMALQRAPKAKTSTGSQHVLQPTFGMVLDYVNRHANNELKMLTGYDGSLPEGHSAADVLIAACDAARRHRDEADVEEAWNNVSEAKLKWMVHDFTMSLHFDAADCCSAGREESSRVWKMEKEVLRKVEDAETRAAAWAKQRGLGEHGMLAHKNAAGNEAEKQLAKTKDIEEQVMKARIAARVKSAAQGTCSRRALATTATGGYHTARGVHISDGAVCGKCEASCERADRSSAHVIPRCR